MNCNNCDSNIPENSKFCPFCGNDSKRDPSLESQVQPTQTVAPMYAPQASVPAYSQRTAAQQPPFKQQTTKRFCKHCGGAVANETKKCNMCGKQYFKITYSAIVVALLCLMLSVSVFLNVTQYNDATNLLIQRDELTAELKTTKTSLSNARSKLNQIAQANLKLSNKLKNYIDNIQ